MFDEAIFARMITDHRQNAGGEKRIPEGRESRTKSLEFIIDRDADGLEAAGKVGRPAPRAEGGPDGVHQVITDPEGVVSSPTDDVAGQSGGPRLVAIVPENRGEVRHGGVVQQIRRRGAPSPPRHPHVERNTGPKGEPTQIGVELPGGDAEVEENEVGSELPDGGQRFGRGVVGLEQSETGVREPAADGGDRLGVLVDPEDGHPSLQQRCGMPPESDSPVHHAGGGRGQIENLLPQDGKMGRRGRVRGGHEGTSPRRNTPPAPEPMGCSRMNNGADGARTRDLRSDSAAL